VKLGDGMMSEIWFSFSKKSTFDGHLPDSPAGRRAAEELLDREILRVISAPDSSRAAEIRNTRLRAYSGSCKDYYLPGLYDEVSQLFCFFQILLCQN
jgi:hypothetical protein